MNFSENQGSISQDQSCPEQTALSYRFNGRAERNIQVLYCTLCKNTVKLCIDTDDMELLLSCEPLGIIKKNNIDELLEYATEKKLFRLPHICLSIRNVISKR